MNQLGPSKSPLGRTRIPADVQLGTALAPSYTRNARANRGRSNFSGAIPKCPFPLDNQNSPASDRKRSRTNHNRQG
jgi:hypothetical protein